ncbi:unnamed protein product [Paramecium pentaurelia]|uniref:Uncharacterized protein n=1 Tax=Paramecium pentaurelia TaxID=43138 RepID=A0A8S1XDK5_9CILI|nr:unnamed protein product [Paramecium pentaurelia]
MGSVCQQGDNIVNWPCLSNPRGSNPRTTFTVIPEEDSVIYSQYDRSVFTASQFYQNPETQRQTVILGNTISGNNKLQILNVYISKLLSSHSIKLTNTRSNAYEVSLTNINPELSCYCEWQLEADKLPICSGDKIDLIHVLTGRYLMATELDEEGVVYCGYGSSRCWIIEFDDNILKDGAIFELKHNEITKYLSFINKKASLSHNTQVCLNDKEGKNNYWKLVLIQ